jgi:hypothetical protein
MSATGRFDVSDYVAHPLGPMRAGLTGVGTAISADLADALRYLQRRSEGSAAWLSHVLVTPTHKDARITAFLSTWAYERHWLGDAIAALAGVGEAVVTKRRTVLRTLRDRLGPLREAIVANVHGHSLTAVQMTERLIDGWIVDAMLERAQALAPAAVAADLGHVRAAVARQGRFFAETATEALGHSRAARALARRRLSRRAWPLGADLEPAQQTAGTIRTLFGTDGDWAAGIDRRIDALPGLSGLGLVRRAVTKPGRAPLRIPFPLQTSRRPAPRPHRKDPRP